MFRFPPGTRAIAGFVLTAACASPAEPVLLAWEGDLTATPPASVSGSAAAASQFGRTEASVLISGAQPDASYGWRISTGTCDQEGAVVGGLAVYPDMVTSAQGGASAETTFAELLVADETYAARVFLGAGGATVVACADLERVR